LRAFVSLRAFVVLLFRHGLSLLSVDVGKGMTVADETQDRIASVV
jgi:hypothetical protein